MKAIVTIVVWVLFLHGLVAIAWGGYDMWIQNGGNLTQMAAISCAIGTSNLLMAAIAARLRHAMEQANKLKKQRGTDLRLCLFYLLGSGGWIRKDEERGESLFQTH